MYYRIENNIGDTTGIGIDRENSLLLGVLHIPIAMLHMSLLEICYAHSNLHLPSNRIAKNFQKTYGR